MASLEIGEATDLGGPDLRWVSGDSLLPGGNP